MFDRKVGTMCTWKGNWNKVGDGKEGIVYRVKCSDWGYTCSLQISVKGSSKESMVPLTKCRTAFYVKGGASSTVSD